MTGIYLLGSTGSIGTQTLEIIASRPEDFQIRSLACKSNITRLRQQIRQFRPEYVSVMDRDQAEMLEAEFPGTVFGFGDAGLARAATFGGDDPGCLVVNALVGISGLTPTLAALEAGRDVALANKETLVVGGRLVKIAAKKHGAKVYPIDSEHSGLWQLINCSERNKIKKVYITASGGAFRDYSRDELENVKPDDALRHPTWNMGKKITIDSATLMNKGFEIIEACHLFDLDISQVEPVLHRESLVHALVRFVDNSIIAQISSHDMRLAISHALNRGMRTENISELLEPADFGKFSFSPIDPDAYPLLKAAIKAYGQGDSQTCVLNAANEAAVDLFLSGKIAFLDIEKIVIRALEETKPEKSLVLDELLALDCMTKERIYNKYDH